MSATVTTTTAAGGRAASLLDAQNKASAMFDEIAATLLRPGVSEKQLSNEIHELGNQRHGVRTHWHKRVVRSGSNTLMPYEENPPDRIIQEDDILFVDLGPVFEEWEADFGRTYVLGDDPVKKKLQADLLPTWTTVKALYDQNPDMTGEELYAIACEETRKAGWEFGEDGFSGDDAHQAQGILHAAANEDESALVRAQHKHASLRKGGIGFTATTTVTSSQQQPGESSLVLAEERASDTVPQRQDRFVAPTGQVVDIDRHMPRQAPPPSPTA
ncbi:hypothetical protein DV737_g2740, partial [Chaetothyriales sp. CBS 132003]